MLYNKNGGKIQIPNHILVIMIIDGGTNELYYPFHINFFTN